MSAMLESTIEAQRLADDAARSANWKRWGPYLAERQWGTVREDYSPDGDCWNSFPHDHARSRAYRWGEDGLLGVTDRQCRLCFALALWNTRDPILKERLFGLTNPEGNHGEDVKECYYYLDSTPTHSYMKALYKYPQREFPYADLVAENARRGPHDREYELTDTSAFADNRYFDVVAEYAKAAPDDLLIRITVANRGPEAATIHVLPTVWFRNTWSWGADEHGDQKPVIRANDSGSLEIDHPTLGRYRLAIERPQKGERSNLLFTENDTNVERLFKSENAIPYVKDAFHEYVVRGRQEAINPACEGTKAAAHHVLTIPAGGEAVLRLRLSAEGPSPERPFVGFDQIVEQRLHEADDFYAARLGARLSSDEHRVARQAYAGLLWSKQFYHYVVPEWIEGDPGQPSPPAVRRSGRNHEWRDLYNRDILSVPDKWEYPWYAAWDLAFHMIAFARIDLEFAKSQLLLLLREWYMHPNGQIPAYEFALGDVNPPVHAWACWRVYKMTGDRGNRDRDFLARAFQKLLLNFTWWVNRKDPHGNHIFGGGFLGLDNIGVFDRSRPLPGGGHLEQADGTAWMAFYCSTMLAMALELARHDPVYEDIASKFFEHFVSIIEAINTFDGTGLWDETDGFYYDHIHVNDRSGPLKVRSMVGLLPLIAVEVLEHAHLERLPGFRRRMEWFLQNRAGLARHVSTNDAGPGHAHLMLAIPPRDRLERMLRYMLDGDEFLSPYGLRSVSRIHGQRPYVLHVEGQEFRVDYTPGESTTGLFGGNSNWRGPIWFPVNYLILEALERYHHFYGDSLKIEFPNGSGTLVTLDVVANELRHRLVGLFLADSAGRRACHGDQERYAADPHWRDLVLFHEYFDGDSGRGVGASHQTGWTALVAPCLEDLARSRSCAAADNSRVGTAIRRRRSMTVTR
jgi:hypothetical protein